MSGKRIYELTEKSNLENDYFMALDKSGTANAQKVNVSKILNPINNISGSSDEYSASKAYTKGELVIHDNKLYVCNTSCSAAAWSTNQGYFTQSTLATEVTNVKSSLSNIGTIINGTKYTFAIAPSGNSGDIGYINLTQGTWIVFVGGWAPTTTGYVQITGYNIGHGWSGTAFQFVVSGIVKLTATTILKVNFTNWGDANATDWPGGYIKAIRIA